MKTLPASLQDAEGIAVAHVNAWQTAYRGIVSDTFLDGMKVEDRARRWQAIIEERDCEILVAKDDKQVLGVISFGKYREPQASPMDGEIWTMYVHPNAWRAGVGRSLMSSALSVLQLQGFASIWVWVLAANPQAIAFYSACGFGSREGNLRSFQLSGQHLEEVALVRDAA